jgi:predicted ester cyclase
MSNKDIVTTWFASIDANTLDKNATMLAEDHMFYNPMTPGPANSQAHIELIKGMVGAFTGAHKIWRMTAEGDFVSAEVQWIGKHTGEFNGIPATGNDVTFTLIDVMEIKNGKISNEHMELNPMAIMAQIGAM